MVDLAKIRKKAKKGNADVPAAVPAASPPPPKPEPEIVASETLAVQPAETPALPSKLEKFKQDAGKRRQSESITQLETTTGAQLELLTFTIAREQDAVDIERIVEIVTPRPITRIPNADRAVVGIVSLRGTIVTLVDVRAKLRHPVEPAETPDTRVVVIDLKGETVGFTVDRVLRVVKIEVSEVEPHPVVHASEQEESIRGVFRAANALTILLDLDKLLESRALATVVA